MSTDDNRIICRRCGENVSRTVGNCPHCGADIRGRRGPIAGMILGLIIIASSITDLEQLWVFGVLGVLLVFGGGYFVYDQRKRIQQAVQREPADAEASEVE